MEKKIINTKSTKEQEKTMVTRAEKANRMKGILRELLRERSYKWNELLDASVKSYTERYPEEAEDVNALKGKMGSALSLMESGGEMRFESGVCSVVANPEEKTAAPFAETPEKKESGRRNSGKKASAEGEEANTEEVKPAAEKSVANKRARNKAEKEKNEAEATAGSTQSEKAIAEPKRRGRKPKAAADGKTEEAGAAESAKESGQTEKPEERPEVPAPRKRGRKPKAVQTAEKAEAAGVSLPEMRAEEKTAEDQNASAESGTAEEKSGLSVKEDRNLPSGKVFSSVQNAEDAEDKEKNHADPEPGRESVGRSSLAVKGENAVAPVFDMTLLFGNGKKSSSVNGARPSKEGTGKQTSEAVAERLAEEPEKKTAEKISEIPEKVAEELAAVSVKEKPAEKKSLLSEFAFLGNASSALKEAPKGETNGLKNAAVGAANTALAARDAAKRAGEQRDAREPSGQLREHELPDRPVQQPRPQAGQAQSVQGQTAKAVQTLPQPKTQAQQAPRLQNRTAQGGNSSGGGTGSSGGRRDGRRGRGRAQEAAVPETAEEILKAEFLKRLRSLGGDYFEYYSVYLLERYSLKNGRRLESMRVSGGGRDGGVDGEIELTDKFGFRETIYIQSKNWDPSKGKEELWVIGETLLQQFIGAAACRQAKDCKQHSRGIFITTSHFTPEAKELLERMSDKFVGYDGDDVFEAAKECSFGLVLKDGEWVLDEALLSGDKAFFNML